jgi:hypothetical protein
MSLQTRTETTPPTWLKTSKSCASCTLSWRSPTYKDVAGNDAAAPVVPEDGEPPSDADPAADCPCAVIWIWFFGGNFWFRV